jgi:tRNA nucleotidyltransferase (CCA-adding enzyme)
VDPSFALNQKLTFHFNSAQKVLSWFDLLFTDEPYMKWTVYFMILLRHKDQKKSEEICNRLELAPKYQKIFIKERLFAEECSNRLHQNMPHKVSDIYRELKGLKIELLLYIMSITTHKQLIKSISYYVTDLRNIKLTVSGKNLQALGLSPSPVYGRILSAVMDAKLNGLVKTHQEELELLKKYVTEFQPA